MSDPQKPPRAKNKWLAQQADVARLKAKKMANGTWATLSDDPLPPGSAVLTISFASGSAPKRPAMASPGPPEAPLIPTPQEQVRDLEWVREQNRKMRAAESKLTPGGFLD